MKRAKVSSVYEGRGRKKSEEGEGESENSSKSARRTAKARKDGVRARKALSIISNKRTMVTRSMTMKTRGQKDEEKLFDLEVIQAKEEAKKNDDDKPMELVQQQPVSEMVVENKGDDDGLLTLDDWPSTWSLEEDRPLFKVGYECVWYSHWETMNGDFWTPMGDINKEPFWNDDIWDFKDSSEIPKP